MINIFTYSFDKWWRPVVFFGFTAVLLFFGGLINKPSIENFSILLFALGLLGLIISTVYQLIKRRWLLAILTTFIIGVSIVAFVFYAITMVMLSKPDRYADNLKIPNNIQINLPLEDTEPDSIFNTDFFLYKSFQPGLYEYVFYSKKIEKGKVYFKAFEVTHNDPLSVDILKERSTINVFNQTDTIVRFVMDKENPHSHKTFTIYEGDFEKPYAARFELWFKPDNGGQEKKLLAKNYKIEGWMH